MLVFHGSISICYNSLVLVWMDVLELGVTTEQVETPPVEQKHFRTLTVKAS